MDKKSEIARRTGSRAVFSATPETPATPEATAPTTAPTTTPTTASAPQPAAAPSAAATQEPTGWWMYHGDPGHTGFVSDSDLNRTNVSSSRFTLLHSLELEGPVLSVPAVTNGYIYVGLANYQKAKGGNGGALLKIDIRTGAIVKTFSWDLLSDDRDAHGFAGMGCTPAVADGRIYFGAFNGKFYCLDEETLDQLWVTDLRNADPKHNQPITNTAGDKIAPAAVIWSSPALNNDRTKLYVGCGEGENPELYSFVFCLDTSTGDVKWIFCTNLFEDDVYKPNQPNVLPATAVTMSPLPSMYSTIDRTPVSMGCSVWGAIAYDKDLNCLYCPTGNQQPEPNNDWEWKDTDGKPVTDYTNYSVEPPPFKPELPSPGYSNGMLKLDADTGHFRGFFQVPWRSNYRPSDIDIDVGGSPMICQWTRPGPFESSFKSVCIGCKNGYFMMCNPEYMDMTMGCYVLPHHKDGTQVETVDRHPNPEDDTMNPSVPNDVSNRVPSENFSGVFNTAAFYPGSNDYPQTISARIFVGVGGPNYHNQSLGIDHETTPFIRAIQADSASDAWPLDQGDPPRYVHGSFVDPNTFEKVGIYTTAGESGLGSPAVVNDVVFCATSKIALYAFDVRDGTLLWYDNLGRQTGGYNGGYGYCLGPAIWKNYVVAGALVFGRHGGILNIYGLTPETDS